MASCDVVDDVDDAERGIEAVSHVFFAGELDGRVGVGGEVGALRRWVRLFVFKVCKLCEVGEEEGPVDEQDGVIVGEAEDIALALVDGDDETAREVVRVEEVRVGLTPC